MDKYIEIIKDRIPWLRKGGMTPAYQHSINVYEILKDFGYVEEICLAWLFHDAIEDGGMTCKDLLAIWLSLRTIELVKMCTHDPKLHWMERRYKMMDNIIDKQDDIAFIIKLADCMDNLRDVFGMLDMYKITRFITQKCPFFVYHGFHKFNNCSIYREFLELYYKQHRALFNPTE